MKENFKFLKLTPKDPQESMYFWGPTVIFFFS